MNSERMTALSVLMRSIKSEISPGHTTLMGELRGGYLLDHYECDLLVEYWEMTNGDHNGKENPHHP